MTAGSVESVQTCQWPSCQLVSDSSLATAIFIDHAYFKVELSRGSIASLTRVWRIFLLKFISWSIEVLWRRVYTLLWQVEVKGLLFVSGGMIRNMI